MYAYHCSKMVLSLLQSSMYYYVLILTILGFASANQFLGCGGYLKTDVDNLDFTQVEIHLYSKDGILKHQTECAPNNGYFMVPFVDIGEYQLRVNPPEGWLFEPMHIDIDVNGKDDDCTNERDINFHFKGFTLSGVVTNAFGTYAGPDGVTIKVVRNKSVVGTTTTKSGGFSLQGIPPGSYDVVASHDMFTFKQHITHATIDNDNAECDTPIIISGYEIHGSVTSQKQQPVPAVYLILSSLQKVEEPIANCKAELPADYISSNNMKGFQFICVTLSDNNGRFYLSNVPSGTYKIIPFHRGESIQFDFEPSELMITVTNQRINQGTSFKVTGFSVQGSVATANEVPVPGASVYVNGKPVDKTDDNGVYTLSHMNEEVYDITVEKADMKFETTKVRVGPDTPMLPQIHPSEFAVCGLVDIAQPPSSDFKVSQIKVNVASENSKQVMKAHLNKNGEYCVTLKPAVKHTVSLVLTSSMVKNGLHIVPGSIDVVVENTPIKNINFKQYLANFQAQVNCIQSCKYVVLELTRDGSSKGRVEVSSDENSVAVDFTGIIPGTYTILASHSDWCWQSKSQQVVVTSSGVQTPVVFVQSGFELVCSISHDTLLKLTYQGEDKGTHQLKKTRNNLCLREVGQYELDPISCHRFDKATPIIYDTAHPKVVSLKATAHQAIIELTLSNFEGAPTEVAVTLTSKNKDVAVNFNLVDGISLDTLTYRLVHWAADLETITITPQSDSLLFEPKTQVMTMHADDCAKVLATFKAIKGKFIEGQVSPALEGVSITITATDSGYLPSPAQLKTLEDGTFSYGPVNPNGVYNIDAVMENYVITPVEEGQFSAKKLSKLEFSVKSPEGDALPDVLLSISGGNFRKNSLTADDGLLTLTKLNPGQYYFKAIKKEYQFTPTSKVIDVSEGQEQVIEIIGERTAFSVLGNVASLNGQPESGVTMRAVSTAVSGACVNHIEETTTSHDGSFCIRGLHPGCNYKVYVHDQSERFNRLMPKDVSIDVEKSDTTGVRFIAFRPSTDFDLSGDIITDRDNLPSLKVSLYHVANNTHTHVQTISMSTNTPFFYFSPVARNESMYIVKLDSSLPVSLYQYSSPAATVFAKGPHKHITFQFDPKLKKFEADTPQASLLTLPITLIIIYLIYDYARIFEFISTTITTLLSGKKEADPRAERRRRR